MLASTVRPRVPEAVLQMCMEGDRVVVENIAMVALEFVHSLNLPLATMQMHKNAKSYDLRIPITVDKFKVCLADMRSIQCHSPARISDVSVVFDEENCHLCIVICNENNMVHFSEIDIIRMHKRAR